MKLFKNEEAFTLVELMVVVGIIGILSAVAIPQFQTYQAKSKTSEAKLHLAAIYTAETTLMGDYDSYATCLEYAGYPGPGTQNYYAVGFDATNNVTNGNVRNNAGSGALGCVDGATFQWQANKRVGNAVRAAGDITAAAVIPDTGLTFVAEAIGVVSASFVTAANCSRWTVDDGKVFTEVVRGY